MQVQQHSLFEFSLAEVDGNGIVMSVQAVNQSLNGGLVKMTDVGCCLAWFLSHHCSGELTSALFGRCIKPPEGTH